MLSSSRLLRCYAIHPSEADSRGSLLLGVIINLIMPSSELSVLLCGKNTKAAKLLGGHERNIR